MGCQFQEKFHVYFAMRCDYQDVNYIKMTIPRFLHRNALLRIKRLALCFMWKTCKPVKLFCLFVCFCFTHKSFQIWLLLKNVGVHLNAMDMAKQLKCGSSGCLDTTSLATVQWFESHLKHQGWVSLILILRSSQFSSDYRDLGMPLYQLYTCLPKTTSIFLTTLLLWFMAINCSCILLKYKSCPYCVSC